MPYRCAWATSATLLEMTSGTRASSMSTLSPSSTTQKLSSRETTSSVVIARLSRRKSKPSSWLVTYLTSHA